MRLRTREFWTEGPGSFVVAVGVALFIRWALMEAYVIPSGSMLPTLLVHDHIFVNKIRYGLRLPFTEKWLARFAEPQRGEVVVFKYPEKKDLFYIKRIIGIPGDRIFYERGNLYINEELVEKVIPAELKSDFLWLRSADFPGEEQQGGAANYVHWEESLGGKTHSILLRKGESNSLAFGPYTVPEGHFFVMGDNRDNSQDSRAWDPKASRAEGRVIFQRDTVSGPIQIPAGTVVKTTAAGILAVKFRTEEAVEMKTAEVSVAVKAFEAGANGNVGADQILMVESEDPQLNSLQVRNPEPTSGGVDKRFVPRDYLVGRAMFVWLSCEDTLPVVSFLCNPLAVRWTRFFHSVQ